MTVNGLHSSIRLFPSLRVAAEAVSAALGLVSRAEAVSVAGCLRSVRAGGDTAL